TSTGHGPNPPEGGTSRHRSGVDILPQQFSQMFRGPVETVINNGYDILYGINDIGKAAANADGAGVIKGLGATFSGLTNIFQNLGSLLSSFQGFGISGG
ncbi:hypothetical protein AVEN_82874-1, partial [Araneus ventricosus]